MALLEGRVAFVTGAARGQGRSHALRLAAEGAAVIAIDVAGPVGDYNGYPAATHDDLDHTRKLLDEYGTGHVVATVDVRDSAALEDVVAQALPGLGGRLDVVVANAGINNWNRFWEMPEQQWLTMLEVNLTGVWRTLRAAVPHMIAAGNGGSIITVSSVAGIKALPGQAHYSAAKHGVVGLTKSAALELGEYGIRVNSIHPWGVSTAMLEDPTTEAMLAAHPQYLSSFAAALPDLPVAEPADITEGVIWLASDASRAVTGTQLTLDMGATKT
jgi:SDR family mycofactocin-dependent oxidoreductase